MVKTVTKFIINMESDGIGDSILATPVVTGFKQAHPEDEVFYRVRKHVKPWLSMYKDVPIITEQIDGTEFYPYRSYPKELESRSEFLRVIFYARECNNVTPVKPKWEVSQEALNFATRWKNSVVLFPYSFWHSRNYPINHWLHLENLLIKKGETTIILDSPGDGARTSMFQGYRFWGLEAEKIAALIKLSKYVVGNDSGMIHLAGALDAPAIAICGPTNGNKVYGFWKSVTPVNGKLICDSCYWRGEYFIPKICNESCINLTSIFPQDLVQLNVSRKGKILM